MHFNAFLTLASAVGLASIAAADAAHSNLDWYGPKQVHTQVCGHPGDEHPEDCDAFYNDVRDELHQKVMDTCKESSCSGSFEHYRFQVSVEAVFPPEARAEFDTQMGHIIGKMLTHENQKAITPTAIETKFTIPSKMFSTASATATKRATSQ